MKYGYDFRDYSDASLHRRLESVASVYATDLLELLRKCLKSSEFFHEILPRMTVNTTEFFRDPSFYKSLREHVLPILRTYPTIKIWSAGCSTGEEPLSLAVLLKEEGLLDRTTIYATDLSDVVLKKATEGFYTLDSIKIFTHNYTKAGGLKSPADYYTCQYDMARFSSELMEKIFYTKHSLVNDSVFAECHLVVCRNVLIYFNRHLQNQVLDLLSSSLIYRGFLALGSKETLQFSNIAKKVNSIDNLQNIFQISKNVPIHSKVNQ